MTELQRALYILMDIGREPASSSYLRTRYGISPATLKRDIAFLRHYGANIESYRAGANHLYRCANFDRVREYAARWIEIEERCSLLPRSDRIGSQA